MQRHFPKVKLYVGAWVEAPGHNNSKIVAYIQKDAYSRYSSFSDAQLPNFLAQFLPGSWQYFLLFDTSWWLDIYPENEDPKSILSDSIYSYIFYFQSDLPHLQALQVVTHLVFTVLSYNNWIWTRGNRGGATGSQKGNWHTSLETQICFLKHCPNHWM